MWVEMETIKNKPDIVTMAKKKRHITLLEKLHRGKSLSRSELKELAQFEKGDSRLEIIETQEQLAKAFKVSLRTVQRWITDGMPVTREGYYNLLEIQAWRLLRNDKKNKLDPDTEKWVSRYRQAKAKQEEIKLKKITGELVDKQEVEKGRVERILVIKKALLSLPHEMAPALAGLDEREILVTLQERIEKIINNFAGENPSDAKLKSYQVIKKEI